MGFGIALAGGGTRGAAHVGVLLALNEAGLYPDAVAGASAGSIVGGLYAAGIPADRLKYILLSLSRRSTRMSAGCCARCCSFSPDGRSPCRA